MEHNGASLATGVMDRILSYDLPGNGIIVNGNMESVINKFESIHK